MRLKKPIFTGVATALITPFCEGRVDYPSFESLLEYQIKNGVNAICVLGTTGESSTVSLRERKSIISCAKGVIGNRVPLLVGTGTNYTERTIRMTKEAEKMGADACLVVTPYYNKTSESGLIEHYKKVAGCVDIPIILYDVPTRTGMKITRRTLEGLKKTNGIVAIKQANPDVSECSRQMAEYIDAYDFYSGNDELTLPLLSLGAKGVISAVSNVAPHEISTLCRSFFDNDIEKSRKIAHELSPLIEEMFSEVSPIPLKCALSLIGMCKNELRLPLSKSTREAEICNTLIDSNII